MGQDLRELFKKEREAGGPKMKSGHKARFAERLAAEIPRRKTVWYPYKIAAAVLLFLGVGVFIYSLSTGKGLETPRVVQKNLEPKEDGGISLGDLSPDLKKVEEYYMASIDLELSQLEVSKDNRMLVDSFMERLGDLNSEYKRLNTELNEMGPNDQTINALIKNLQLRLELLQKLKSKLSELKSSKNEQVETNTI
ncbi:MAG: hypothetical protein AAGA86_11350 [Bacteroidota bacterium]